MRVSRLVGVLLIVACLLIPAPSALAEEPQMPLSGRWVEVDLTAHMAYAIEDGKVLRTIPMTSGKPKYETPTGTFQIFSRVDDETMSSETMGVPRDAPEGYFLEHIRYVQYFAPDGVALHANYWQPDNVFGNYDTSHGCVSMRLADAEYLWNFATWGTTVVVRRGETQVTVPDARGVDVAEARARLGAAGLGVEEQARVTPDQKAGLVLEQQPGAGARVRPGEKVKLVIAAAPPKHIPAAVRPPEGDYVWVPEIVGLTEAEARARLDQAGLMTTYTNYQQESDIVEGSRAFFRSVEPGSVLSSSPSVGERVPKGLRVALAVRKP